MNRSKTLGRLGVLAATLGAGAAVAATAGTASADVATSSVIPDAAASIDASSLSALMPAAATPFGQDLAISFNGMTLFDNDGVGGTTATSVTGSYGFALAYGDDAVANSGGSATSLFNTAIADGAGSNALSNGGNFGTAIASGAESSAYSNGIGNFVSATGYESNASAALGDYNSVIVNGTGSSASVLGLGGGGDGNLLTVFGANNLADTSGVNNILAIFGNGTGISGDDATQVTTSGTNNIAAIFGDGGFAQAAGGDNNIAAIFGDGGFAQAVLGSGNIAAIFGDGSSAEAVGTNNFAAVFGDLLGAVAQGNGMTDIEPSSSMATMMADLLGGSAASVDASWLTDFLDGSWLTGLFG